MPKTKILLAVSMLLLATLACNTLLPATEPPSAPATEADVPRVPLEQALAAYSDGAAVFVDVRSPQSYQISHIPGAINIPLGTFETDIASVNLDKDAWIITYCT